MPSTVVVSREAALKEAKKLIEIASNEHLAEVLAALLGGNRMYNFWVHNVGEEDDYLKFLSDGYAEQRRAVKDNDDEIEV